MRAALLGSALPLLRSRDLAGAEGADGDREREEEEAEEGFAAWAANLVFAGDALLRTAAGLGE